MRFSAWLVTLLIASLVSLNATSVIAQEAPPIIQSLAFNTGGNTDVLVGQYNARRAIDAELGVNANVRYYQVSFAGDATGTVIAVLEWENLAALADAQDKRRGNEALAELGAELLEAGIAVVANSIAVDITPAE